MMSSACLNRQIQNGQEKADRGHTKGQSPGHRNEHSAPRDRGGRGWSESGWVRHGAGRMNSDRGWARTSQQITRCSHLPAES
ncbi:hypothetical protein WR25_06182 [Diploscapter pachys]|uniref:Uncharacterized protein n=1 Tax=Diploscapter pachys TaxID=2018661 RepID=A0A2A2LSQ3_9BILA|nr:hypothetical protein WR25_06182 [Diploscapter pachys]